MMQIIPVTFGIYLYVIHLPYIIRTSLLIKVRHSETTVYSQI